VGQRDYVGALEALRIAGGELELVEAEIRRLDEGEATCRARIDALRQKLAAARAAHDHEELLPRFETVEGEFGSIEQTMDEFDFTSALGQIASSDAELDAIAAEAAILDARREAEEAEKARLRAEWERCAPRLEAAKGRIAELDAFGAAAAPDLAARAGTVEEEVGQERWREACALLPEVEAALEGPYAEFARQRAAQQAYERDRPQLDARVAAARGSGHADAQVSGRLDAVDAGLAEIGRLAEAKDYLAANERMAPVRAELDQIESALRELETRARVAAEMGLDPNQCTPEVEREAARRLYEEERRALEARIAAVRDADVGGREIEAALGQLDTNLVSMQASADAGDFEAALEGVRDSVAEMGRAEEALRRQTELRARYEAAVADVRGRLGGVAGNQFRTVADAAAALEARLADAERFAEARDYEGALGEVSAIAGQIGPLEQQASALATSSAAAQTAMLALQPRVARVWQSFAPPRLPPNAQVIADEMTAAEELIRAERFDDALEKLRQLETMVSDFEAEAETEQARQRYLDALETLDIEARVGAMVSRPYPEIEAESLDVAGAHTAMTRIAESEDWGAARNAAFDVSRALQAYDRAYEGVMGAKAAYETAAPAFTGEMLDAVPADLRSDAQLARLLGDLERIHIDMETAATENRFHAALDHLSVARDQLNLVYEKKHELLEVDAQVVNDFIADKARISVLEVKSGINEAADRFGDWAEAQIKAAKPDRGWVRYITGTLDVLSAVVGVGNPIAGALISTVKVSVEIGAGIDADILDDQEAAAEAMAREAKREVRNIGSEVGRSYNAGFPQELQNKNAAVWDSIAEHLRARRPGDAAAALYAVGLPSPGANSGVAQAIFGQLVDMFNASGRMGAGRTGSGDAIDKEFGTVQ
jgi:hypothetical protein